MQRISESEVKVTREDQNMINTFSKHYQKRQELDETLVRLKEKVNQHQDTLDEIDFTDDTDVLRYRFGACFFHLPADQVRTLVQKEIDRVKDEQKHTTKEHEEVEKRMKKLKATLYSKFGNSINLED
jgi:prefoldin subunit 4